MAVSKKSTKKPVAKKSSALHEKILKLFARPNGATINDLNEAGFKYSARQALRIAETRSLKTNVVKKNGELVARYIAKKA